MTTDRAADRFPPLPAPAKVQARDARTIVAVDDADTPAKAVVPGDLCGHRLVAREIGRLSAHRRLGWAK